MATTLKCAALVMLLLAACSVDQQEIEIATRVCEPHGGLKWIMYDGYEVTCNNGVRVKYRKLMK